MARLRKFFNRAVRKVKAAAKARYVTKTGKGLRVNQIVKDVAYLKSVLNPEKKRFNLSSGSNNIAQLNGATGQGAFIADITPIPAQGSSSITRNGNSIKLHSTWMRYQFSQQSATTQPIKIQMLWIKTFGATQSGSTFLANAFVQNPFVLNGGSPAIIDINSDMNPDYMKQYRILRKKTFTLPVDQYSGVTQIKTFGIGLKYRNHHVRFAADASTTVTEGQIFLVVLCDSGNLNGATASTLTNVPVSAVNTGATMSLNLEHYYYDN